MTSQIDLLSAAEKRGSSAGMMPRLLLVTAFSSVEKGSRTVMEELELRLNSECARSIAVSDRRTALARGTDMVLTTLLRRHDFDVAIVDIFSGRAFLWAEAVCAVLRRFRKPHIAVLHGGGLPGFARGRERRIRRTLEGAATVVAPSRYLQEQMRNYRNDIEVLFNAIDLSGYKFRLREAFKPHLVWLRAFHEIYNPQLAPRVVALLVAEFPDVSLVMVGRDKGDGSLQATQELAAHLGVADRISFPGGVSKTAVPDWLNGGEIFLNTTNVDNTPISVIEAMACGLPVVSTNVGGIPYLLKTEEDALLVPPNDPAAMAAAIGRILRDPTLARRLSRNAHATAEQCSWSLVLPRWKELIAKAAGQGETPLRMEP